MQSWPVFLDNGAGHKEVHGETGQPRLKCFRMLPGERSGGIANQAVSDMVECSCGRHLEFLEVARKSLSAIIGKSAEWAESHRPAIGPVARLLVVRRPIVLSLGECLADRGAVVARCTKSGIGCSPTGRNLACRTSSSSWPVAMACCFESDDVQGSGVGVVSNWWVMADAVAGDKAAIDVATVCAGKDSLAEHSFRRRRSFSAWRRCNPQVRCLSCSRRNSSRAGEYLRDAVLSRIADICALSNKEA